VPQADLDLYRDRFMDISSGRVPKPVGMVMMRDIAIAKQKGLGESQITKLQDFQDDEVFFSYCKHPNILRWVKAIIGENVKSMHYMLINKPPDVGLGSSRHPPHQDQWYFPWSSADQTVCAWTAMQVINKENGCLFVQPGTHKGPLLLHEYPNDGVVNKAYHGIQNMSSEKHGDQMLHLEMEPGDCVFFHPHLIHGSGRNNSKGYRKAISCHYAASDCKWEDVSGTIQEFIRDELADMMRLRGSTKPFSFIEYWRLRARLVSRRDGTLS